MQAAEDEANQLPAELMRRYEAIVRPRAKQRTVPLRAVSAAHIGKLVRVQARLHRRTRDPSPRHAWQAKPWMCNDRVHAPHRRPALYRHTLATQGSVRCVVGAVHMGKLMQALPDPCPASALPCVARRAAHAGAPCPSHAHELAGARARPQGTMAQVTDVTPLPAVAT